MGSTASPPAHEETATVELPAHLRKKRLRPAELCEYLEAAHGIEIKPSTLATWRCRGGGPPFVRFNRTPLYPRDLADTWAHEKLGDPITSTSEV